jgi:hypothetical protein
VGGFGSGRHSGTATAEGTASYVIDIKSLAPAFRRGQSLTGEIKFDDGRFPVLVTVDLRNEWNRFVELIHLTRDDREGGRMVTGQVQLTRTEPTYGGHRWWFLCPRTGRRATKLLLPNGGRHFWSRDAYGLGYACQREDRLGRLQRRVRRLNHQLGGKSWTPGDNPPRKPKWMRRRTYGEKYEQWKRAVAAAREEFISRSARYLRRFHC